MYFIMEEYIPTPEVIEEIKQLLEQKWSINKIAKKFNVGWRVIKKIVNKNNFVNRQCHASILENEELVNSIKKII